MARTAIAMVHCAFAGVYFAKFQYKYTISALKRPLPEENCCAPPFKSEVQGLDIVFEKDRKNDKFSTHLGKLGFIQTRFSLKLVVAFISPQCVHL